MDSNALSYMQHIYHCKEHTDCTVITCIADKPIVHQETNEVMYPAGTQAWESHWQSGIHAEHRINSDLPAIDHRQGDGVHVVWTEPCTACVTHPQSPWANVVS